MMDYAVISAAIFSFLVLIFGIKTRFAMLKHVWDPKNAIKKKHFLRILYFSAACAAIMILLFTPGSKKISTARTAHIEFLVDVSRSMGAERPLGTPNRVQRSGEIITAICDAYPDIHTALYAFTRITRSHAYFPETGNNDKNCGYIKNTVDDVLRIESVAQQGSDIAGALQIGAISFPKEAESRVLILFSDGEYTEGGKKFVSAFSELKKRNIKLIVVGVGEKGGAFIPIYYTETGEIVGVEQTDTGKGVFTFLREETLRTIAGEAGGSYFGEEETDDIINEIGESLVLQEQEAGNFFSPTWRIALFAVFLLMACLFLKSIT